jgi:hypothetical protein
MKIIFESTKIAVGILMLFLGSYGFVFGIVAMTDPVVTNRLYDAGPFGFSMTLIENFSVTAFYLGVVVFGIGILSGKENIERLLGGKL